MKTISTVICLTLFSWGALSGQSTIVGTTEPIRETNLSFSESGTLVEILVKEGQSVSEGQVLTKLDTKVLDASLRIAKIRAESRSAVQSAEANWNLRKRRFDELKRLHKSGSANQDEVERAQAEFEIADADLATAKEESASQKIQVEQITAQIKRRTISSPFAGVVTRIHQEIGEVIQPGQGPVLTVVQLDQLHLVLHVDHQAARNLYLGQLIPVRRVSETAKTQPTISAKVSFVSPVTDPASGTTRVKLSIDNSKLNHRAGLKYSADISIPSSQTNTN